MSVKQKKSSFDLSKIEKIEALSSGEYQVFFTFSKVPVVMNRAYLETVLPLKEAYHYL